MISRAPLTTYLKLCTEFYDLEHHRGKPEASFYMDYALQAGGPILEPMCGTGRFLLAMLDAGLDIEGFDASPHMLDALKQKWSTRSFSSSGLRPFDKLRVSGKQKHAPREAPVWQQFLQDFTSDKRYHLIFIPYGSFGLILNPDDVQKSLMTLYNQLAPGGKLILDIETIDSVPHPCGIWRRGVNTRADGSLIAINTLTSYDEQAQLFTSLCRYESIVDGTIVATELEDFRQYLYRFTEMDELLKQFNFARITKYMNYSKTIATNEQAPLLIYECVK